MAAYGLYTHIQSNRRRSIFLLIGLFFLVYVMVFAGALVAEAMTYDASLQWLLQRAFIDAVKASYALPGVFAPVHVGGRWLMDGALVNPVPVSAARALGARVVIAVNLNADLIGRGSTIASVSFRSRRRRRRAWKRRWSRMDRPMRTCACARASMKQPGRTSR